MKLCDLHCDTAFELYKNEERLSTGNLHITADKMSLFDAYVQLSAICAQKIDSDNDAYECFFAVKNYFLNELSSCGYNLCTNSKQIKESVKDGIPAFILTVEDARILDGDISRLQKLYDSGVRLITPMWEGVTCIGGAHDTSFGLTDFGYEVAKSCAKLGIITDISHASEKSADELCEIADQYGMPVTATHSDSFSLNSHSRNLRDSQLIRLKNSGGVVGVNLYPPHLTNSDLCVPDTVAKHIIHFLNIAENGTVCLGCDFDGISHTTDGLENVSKMPNLKLALVRNGIPSEICENIFFNNAYSFLIKHLI